MARSSYHQSDFRGGEWSPEAQGRSDDPKYRTALAKCLNGVPVEAGAWVRRSGTEFLAYTYNRGAAKLIAYLPASARPYVMEFTASEVRFFLGTGLVFTTDTAQTVSGATYDGSNFHVTIGAAGAYQNGDQVMLNFPSGYTPSLETGLRNRVLMVVAGGGTTTLTLGDDQGNALSGFTLPGGGLVSATVYRVLRVAAPWGLTELPNLRAIQAGTNQIILSSQTSPHIITESSAPTATYMAGLDDRLYLVTSDDFGVNHAVEMLRPFFGQEDAFGTQCFVDQAVGIRPIIQAGFTITTAAFIDGPYADLKNETGTVSGTSGSITFTPATSTFVANDVGRCIRLFSEPPAWAVGTTYAYGALVKYNGSYWQSTQGSNVGNYPGTPTSSGGVVTTFWAPAPNAARWVWGTITAQGGSSCTLTLTDSGATGGAAGTIPSGNGTTITNWQLGLFEPGAWPTCGAYHEGRLVLAGAVTNRFDMSMSNQLLQFSPTDQYGNVNDNNAIDATFNAPSQDQIYWMFADDRGLIVGTLGGEWLVSSSTAGEDTITPTNVKARQITSYGCANIEPRRAGLSLIFVQRYALRLYEYLADTFSQRFSGKHLNEKSRHLAASGIAEIAYIEEPSPIIWCRMNDGTLVGVTYRRVSRFVTEEPVFNAWHQHRIGA